MAMAINTQGAMAITQAAMAITQGAMATTTQAAMATMMAGVPATPPRAEVGGVRGWWRTPG